MTISLIGYPARKLSQPKKGQILIYSQIRAFSCHGDKRLYVGKILTSLGRKTSGVL
jgi:hypothetical protein